MSTKERLIHYLKPMRKSLIFAAIHYTGLLHFVRDEGLVKALLIITSPCPSPNIRRGNNNKPSPKE
jgi:hypothetical protein